MNNLARTRRPNRMPGRVQLWTGEIGNYRVFIRYRCVSIATEQTSGVCANPDSDMDRNLK